MWEFELVFGFVLATGNTQLAHGESRGHGTHLGCPVGPPSLVLRGHQSPGTSLHRQHLQKQIRLGSSKSLEAVPGDVPLTNRPNALGETLLGCRGSFISLLKQNWVSRP